MKLIFVLSILTAAYFAWEFVTAKGDTVFTTVKQLICFLFALIWSTLGIAIVNKNPIRPWDGWDSKNTHTVVINEDSIQRKEILKTMDSINWSYMRILKQLEK